MYLPTVFREEDPDTLLAFLDQYSFATLVTHTTDGLMVTHLPLLLRRSVGDATLVGHFARANPHWRTMDGETPTLAIFHGPHAYVSPRWYESRMLVPTWNYAVVHASGFPRFRDEGDFAMSVVNDLTACNEASAPAPWRSADLVDETRLKLLSAIVAFEMPISRLEGKFKLSQNRSEADLNGAIAGLEGGGDAGALAVAALMRRAGRGT